MLLGDLGAEILKIEPPGIGDETRVIPPYRGGESHYFLAINRNKQSLVVDLKQEAGQQVLLDLVPHSRCGSARAVGKSSMSGCTTAWWGSWGTSPNCISLPGTILSRWGLATTPLCPMVPIRPATGISSLRCTRALSIASSARLLAARTWPVTHGLRPIAPASSIKTS